MNEKIRIKLTSYDHTVVENEVEVLETFEASEVSTSVPGGTITLGQTSGWESDSMFLQNEPSLEAEDFFIR